MRRSRNTYNETNQKIKNKNEHVCTCAHISIISIYRPLFNKYRYLSIILLERFIVFLSGLLAHLSGNLGAGEGAAGKLRLERSDRRTIRKDGEWTDCDCIHVVIYKGYVHMYIGCVDKEAAGNIPRPL